MHQRSPATRNREVFCFLRLPYGAFQRSTLRLGSSTITVPPGSFKQNRERRYVFEGAVGSVRLEMSIGPARDQNTYAFRVEGSGANFTGVPSPITLVLTIGDDSGTTIVGSEHDE
jgi:hypothetical protein